MPANRAAVTRLPPRFDLQQAAAAAPSSSGNRNARMPEWSRECHQTYQRKRNINALLCPIGAVVYRRSRGAARLWAT